MRRVMTAVLAAAMGLGLMAAGPTMPPGFTPPKWLRKPRPEDMLRVWPEKAFADHMSGKATIHCKVSTAGTLFDCKLIDEFPKGSGFGSAAIVLSAQFLMSPALQDGAPVIFDGVTLPIDFVPPERPTGTRLRGGYYEPDMKTLVTGLPWRAAPTAAEMAGAYPPKAAAARQSGRVVLNCFFNDDGRVRTCDTVTEEPKGEGFASAAHGLAKSFVAPLTLENNRPINQVRGQISFTFSPDLLEPQPLATRPTWLSLPAPEDLANAFPAKARAAGLKMGRATLGCVANAQGGLDACEVQSEDPPGYGFGQATLGLAPAFRLKTWTDDGRPMVGGRVRVPLRYEDEPAAKP